jgi:hypothetical protein
MMFEPGDRVKLAELPVGELRTILASLALQLNSPNLLPIGEVDIVERVVNFGASPPSFGYWLCNHPYCYPEAALQHACSNWQLRRELRRVAAELAAESASTGVDRSAYLTGMTESLEVR